MTARARASATVRNRASRSGTSSFKSSSTAAGPAWLSDYDQSTLHAADSMWVVRGRLESPMGGGFAAFLDSAAAAAVAVERSGRTGRLTDFTGEVPR